MILFHFTYIVHYSTHDCIISFNLARMPSYERPVESSFLYILIFFFVSCIFQRFGNEDLFAFFWLVCNLAYLTSPINEILNLIFYEINRYFSSSSSYATSSMSSTRLTSLEVDGLETHAPLFFVYIFPVWSSYAVNCFLSYKTKEENLFRSKIVFMVMPSFLQSNNVFLSSSIRVLKFWHGKEPS